MNTTTETLVTCPDCGTPNFSPRGLTAHKGRKHCLSVQVKNAVETAASTAAQDDPPALAPTHLAALTVFAFRKGDAPYVEPFDFAKSLELREVPSIAWVCPVHGPGHEGALGEAKRAFDAGEGMLTAGGVQAGLLFPKWKGGAACNTTAVAGDGIPSAARPITLVDLEVLPPIKRAAAGRPMPMEEIEDHLRQFDAKIVDRTRGYHNEVIYDIVGKGLMLLKARSLHVVEAATQFQIGNKKAAAKNGVETVSTPSEQQLSKLEEKGEGGFLGWLGEKFPDQSSRTARNYMNAARNAGLTSDHGLEDVEALRTTQALHEKKPTDLYRLAEPAKNTGADDNSGPPVNLVAETTRNLFLYLDQSLQLREDMEPEDFEACTQRLKATLEKMTGHRWEMGGEAPDDAAVHGEVAEAGHEEAQRTQKKGGGTLADANKRAQIAAQQKARWAKAGLRVKGVNA